MKELATFFGKGGETVAFLFEGDGFWKVNYGTVGPKPNLPGNPLSSKIFKTEEEATRFASEYTDKGNSPLFLSE